MPVYVAFDEEAIGTPDDKLSDTTYVNWDWLVMGFAVLDKNMNPIETFTYYNKLDPFEQLVRDGRISLFWQGYADNDYNKKGGFDADRRSSIEAMLENCSNDQSGEFKEHIENLYSIHGRIKFVAIAPLRLDDLVLKKLFGSEWVEKHLEWVDIKPLFKKIYPDKSITPFAKEKYAIDDSNHSIVSGIEKTVVIWKHLFEKLGL